MVYTPNIVLLMFISSGWDLLVFLPLILACPLGMWIMMRNMNRGGGSKNAGEIEPSSHGQTPEDDTRKC